MQCRMPFEGGGLPGVGGREGSAAQAAMEIDEEENLRGGEKDGGVGDVEVEGESVGEKLARGAQRTAGAGDAGELGVVAGLSGEAGEMHGEEGRVGSDDGEPEVEAAEGFGHQTPSYEREPIVGCGEEAEDAGHGHDEVEVGDDEDGVVEVLVQNGLGEDGAGKTTGDEERDEAEGEEHGGGVVRLRAPGGGEPAQDLGGGGQRDGHGGDGEGGAGEGVEAGDEHVVSPEEDAQEADEQGGGDHRAIGEDPSMAEVRNEHRGEAHAGEDGDVKLGVPEEPEEMEPEERAAGAAVRIGGVKDTVDQVSCGEEEAGSGVAIGEEEEKRGEEDGEGDEAEQCSGEPSPYGEGEAFPGHAVATEADDGDQGIDCGDHGRNREQRNAAEPEVHSEGLPGACRGDGAEGWVGGPSGDRAASWSEGGADQHDERKGREPEAGCVQG